MINIYFPPCHFEREVMDSVIKQFAGDAKNLKVSISKDSSGTEIRF